MLRHTMRTRYEKGESWNGLNWRSDRNMGIGPKCEVDLSDLSEFLVLANLVAVLSTL